MNETDPQPSEEADSSDGQDQLIRQIVESLKQGNKIQAIKDYRDATGSGLKESKEVIDGLIAKYEIPMKSGCASMILIAVSAACILVFATLI